MATDIRLLQKNIIKDSILKSRIVPKRIKETAEVFEDYFGKDNVELQVRFQGNQGFIGNLEISTGHLPLTPDNLKEVWQNSILLLNVNLWCIVIYRPKLTVTNEDGKSIDIEDLYIVIPMSIYGTTSAYPVHYLRTTYSSTQWNAGYLHSHAPHVEQVYVSTPQCVCLGTGPINDTIRQLNIVGFNYMLWKIFAMQLDQITRVESLTGGPYIRLDDIERSALQEIPMYVNPQAIFRLPAHFSGDSWLTCFIKSLIADKKIHFRISEGGLQIAEQFIEFLQKISDYYFKWQNLVLETYHVTPILFNIQMYKIKNGVLYEYNEAEDTGWTRVPILTFKGQCKYLNVYKDSIVEQKEPYIDATSAMALHRTLTGWANYRYAVIQNNDLFYEEEQSTNKGGVLYL